MIKVLTTLILSYSVITSGAIAEREQVIYTLPPEIEDQSVPKYDSAKIFFNRVTKRMQFADYPKIILVGMDTGRVSQHIAEKIDDSKVINYVLNPDYAAYAQFTYSHPRVQTLPGDVLRNDRVLRDSADFVYSSWVVGLLPEDRQVVALKSMRYMLKDGGTCAVIFPMKGSVLSQVIDEITSRGNWANKFANVKVPQRTSYRPDQYAGLMSRAGFQDVKAEKHVYSMQFNDRAEFESFIHTGISRYKTKLNEDESAMLVKDIADEYLERHNVVEGNPVPYQVDMVVATAVKRAEK